MISRIISRHPGCSVGVASIATVLLVAGGAQAGADTRQPTRFSTP